jgi:phosphoenolpyruvate---glycerone phosphotransferase subunit DhaK
MPDLFLPSEDAVAVAVRGFARAHHDLVDLHESPLYLTARHRHPRRRAGLVSGGGSGHEPLHVGFLGAGMLDAAAPGRIFASPHNRQVLEASRAVAGPDGVLHIVKNYTGDRINFAIAAERLRAEGVEVRRVLVDDDLATESDQTGTGRRGTAATVVVEKILGAAADEEMGLEELGDLGDAVAAASRSIAVASRAQSSPSTGQEGFDLEPGLLEYGVGIHGERAPGTVDRAPFERLVETMVGQVHAAVPGSGPLLVLVNGLGATTALELHAVFEHAAAALERRGEEVADSLVGTVVPALDMSGFSVSLTRLRPDWLRWWQAPAWTPALRRGASR